MKLLKKIIPLLFALAIICTGMCMSTSAAAVSGQVIFDDGAGIYTDAQITELKAIQTELAQYTGWNIAVVTTDVGFGTDGYNAVEYAEQYYDDAFGYSSDGILYLIDLDYRHFCTAGSTDYDYFNDYRIEQMSDACEECYFDYDDMGNVKTFYNYVRKYYDAGPFAEAGLEISNQQLVEIVFSGLICGLIAAAIGVAIVFGRYKFHSVPSTNNYLEGSSIYFYNRQDRFIREFTTRTRINSNSGGHGGGGHGSSGGHSHGGGGHGGRR